MVRENDDGTRMPLTMPNHATLKSSTLRTICTQAGIKADTRHNDPLSMHADCACAVACHACPAGKVAKALQAGWAMAVATPETTARWFPERLSEHARDAQARAANAIRGPPFPV